MVTNMLVCGCILIILCMVHVCVGGIELHVNVGTLLWFHVEVVGTPRFLPRATGKSVNC